MNKTDQGALSMINVSKSKEKFVISPSPKYRGNNSSKNITSKVLLSKKFEEDEIRLKPEVEMKSPELVIRPRNSHSNKSCRVEKQNTKTSKQQKQLNSFGR